MFRNSIETAPFSGSFFLRRYPSQLPLTESGYGFEHIVNVRTAPRISFFMLLLSCYFLQLEDNIDLVYFSEIVAQLRTGRIM